MHRIAIHEAGHAVTTHILCPPLPDMVRVTARGGAYLGKTPVPATKKVVCDHIAVTLGRRAAKAVLLGSVSNGAESDLSQLDPHAPLGSDVNANIKSYYLCAKKII